ncbi:hypothetical protein BDN70DRAFT_921093 [Pholiota conissans]|uniref:Uncharacterized protein n=1 Tax=Pholiota conissans TaxID=109636 RepID=A0A9P6D1G5_9AGAR|nr:hypothetical protein BDN70DRAFT_921093 [Pholiota conissans]
MKKPPKDAFFSGYSIKYEYFQKLVVALTPGYVQKTGQQSYYLMYVLEYDRWRRDLPENERDNVPLLKVFHGPNRMNENVADANSKFFFWTRWAPAPDGSSAEAHPQMRQETNIDRIRREELIALIKRRSGFSVDKARLQFECVKHRHPSHDLLQKFDY